MHLWGLVHIAEVHDVYLATAIHIGYLLVLEVDDLLGVFHDRRGVAAEGELLMPAGIGSNTYHQRRALAGTRAKSIVCPGTVGFPPLSGEEAEKSFFLFALHFVKLFF